MQNLGMLLRLAKRITPQMDVKAVGEEIRARITDELDYELEASNHRTLARLYRGHPFIHVPAVVTDLCRERVIVTEYVEGSASSRSRRPRRRSATGSARSSTASTSAPCTGTGSSPATRTRGT